MKPFAGIVGLGALAIILQSLLGTFFPQRFVPDLGLLLVVALGLSWRGFAGGVVLAALLGYLTDLLSGSLLGQHMLLRMLVFVAACLGSRHLSLLGPMPRALFVAGLTFANALLVAFLTSAFTGGVGLEASALSGLAPQMFLNALCARPAAGLIARAMALLSDDSERKLRLETRSVPV